MCGCGKNSFLTLAGAKRRRIAKWCQMERQRQDLIRPGQSGHASMLHFIYQKCTNQASLVPFQVSLSVTAQLFWKCLKRLYRLWVFLWVLFLIPALTWDERADIKHRGIILWYLETLRQLKNIVNFQSKRLTFPQNVLIIAVFRWWIKFVLISCFREHIRISSEISTFL